MSPADLAALLAALLTDARRMRAEAQATRQRADIYLAGVRAAHRARAEAGED